VGSPQDTPLLVVDDDAAVREFVARTLRLAGYEVLFAEDGEGVPELVLRQHPRLVIMDISMPRVSGIDALRQLRSQGSDIPVIVLTAHGADEDKLAAFEAGADDYLVKPFSSRELVARVGAVLRRARMAASETQTEAPMQAGPVTLVPGNHSALIRVHEVGMTSIEYPLLMILASHAGLVFTPT